jgi:hypothetical protein
MAYQTYNNGREFLNLPDNSVMTRKVDAVTKQPLTSYTMIDTTQLPAGTKRELYIVAMEAAVNEPDQWGLFAHLVDPKTNKTKGREQLWLPAGYAKNKMNGAHADGAVEPLNSSEYE